jgi:hypothetical protein
MTNSPQHFMPIILVLRNHNQDPAGLKIQLEKRKDSGHGEVSTRLHACPLMPAKQRYWLPCLLSASTCAANPHENEATRTAGLRTTAATLQPTYVEERDPSLAFRSSHRYDSQSFSRGLRPIATRRAQHSGPHMIESSCGIPCRAVSL